MARRTSLLALGLIATIGFTSGVRVAIGDVASLDGVEAAAPETSLRTRDPLSGSLWIPSGSTVTHRTLDPRPVMWLPPSSTARSDPSLRARQYRSPSLRIAALDH
jgi:hypothetical protein